MDGKVAVVTGATQGIGLESAVGLARLGARVLMVGRDQARGQAALADVKARSSSDKVELLLADLSSLAEVRKLAAEVKSRTQKLDVLLNNAGAIHQSRKLSADGFEMTFAVNHLSYFLLTNLLLDLLKQSAPSRIVSVASDAHRGMSLDFDDLQSEKSYRSIVVYGKSKLANILFTYELARRLEGTKVTANCLHPGVIASGFGKNDPGIFKFLLKLGAPFLMSPEKGARTQVYLASSPEVEGVSGRYFKDRKPIDSSRASRDSTSQRRLWDLSEEMTGLKRAAA
jgi:NAD(P)-dependent dehydrogenase (short-subunit alcohol dehydrogenase family)